MRALATRRPHTLQQPSCRAAAALHGRPAAAACPTTQQHRSCYTAPAATLAATAARRHLLAATSCSLATACLLPGRRARGAAVVMAAQAGGSSGQHDLLIVGPGVLGSHLGVLWREAFPGATVTAQTNSDNNHAKLRELGLSPVTRDAAPAGKQYPYVLFAAPPSGSEDYPGAVAAAAAQWDGSGSLLFTSSMSVCATEDGSTVGENCPLVPKGKSPSTDRLLGAESAVLSARGNVLRLVGLYHAGRGPHTFFIKQGEVARYGGYSVNMLHYEDAARLALAILRGDGCSAAEDGGNYRGAVFVGCDNHPLTFQEMVDACVASGQFGAGAGSVTFTGTPENGGGLGKVVTNDATRRQLGGWTPKYDSFQDFFLKQGGQDVYNSGAAAKAVAVGAPHQ